MKKAYYETTTGYIGIVKGNMLWKNSRAGFSIGALLLGLGGFSKLSADDLRLYASHPNPAADYTEAVRRVESKIATEVDFDPGSHSFLLTHGAKTAKAIIFVHGYPGSPSPFKEFAAQFYGRGYNALVMTIPCHRLADRMNTEHAKLRAEDFMRYGDEIVDIARGFGDHMTMAGISGGGCGRWSAGWTGGATPSRCRARKSMRWTQPTICAAWAPNWPSMLPTRAAVNTWAVRRPRPGGTANGNR